MHYPNIVICSTDDSISAYVILSMPDLPDMESYQCSGKSHKMFGKHMSQVVVLDLNDYIIVYNVWF